MNRQALHKAIQMAMEPPETARTIEKTPFGMDYEVDYDIFSTLENLSDTYRAPKDRFEKYVGSCVTIDRITTYLQKYNRYL